MCFKLCLYGGTIMIKKLLNWLREEYGKCFYIGKCDVLPPPLSKEEEFDCFVKARNGDVEAKNKLIEHNLRLVVFLAKKYESTGYDMEDLVSIGSIGLIKGINTYKMDKNIKFATYASRCIANEILMYIRKNKKRKQEISLEDSLNYDSEGNELHLEDVLGTETDLVSDAFEKNQERKFLEGEINKLSPRERQIMILRYGLNNQDSYTQKEVADLLGISQSYISRIEKKVIRNIKNLMKV